jgi:hypothetical protein
MTHLEMVRKLLDAVYMINNTEYGYNTDDGRNYVAIYVPLKDTNLRLEFTEDGHITDIESCCDTDEIGPPNASNDADPN